MITAILATIYFFSIIIALGYSVFRISHFKDPEQDGFYSFLAYGAAGLATLALLIPITNVLHLPIHYLTYLIIALVIPCYDLFTQKPWEHLTFPKWDLQKTLLCVVFLLFLGIYLQGAFSYPYLEDDDSWGHAAATQYIHDKGSYTIPDELQEVREHFGHYLEPYPPTYDAIISLVWGISGSMSWSLKATNVYMLALHIFFFFLLVSVLLKSRTKALVAASILAVLPSSMSHFIWAHSLAMTMLYAALYLTILVMERLENKTSKRTAIVAIIAIAACMIIHPFISFLFGFFFTTYLIYLCSKEVMDKSIKNTSTFLSSKTMFLIIIGALGVLVSFIYWGEQMAHYGIEEILVAHGGGFSAIGAESTAFSYVNPDYSLKEIVIAGLSSKMDQQTGFGIFVLLLALLALIVYFLNYKLLSPLKTPFALIIFWFLFLFLSLIKVIPLNMLLHRFWCYVSFPLSILAAEGVMIMYNSSKKNNSMSAIMHATVVLFLFLLLWKGKFLLFDAEPLPLVLPKIFGWSIVWAILIVELVIITLYFSTSTSKWLLIGTMVLLGFGLFLSSAYPKYKVQTSQWPPGVFWSSPDEISGYINLKQQLKGSTPLFTVCLPSNVPLGFDLAAYPYNPIEHELRKRVINATPVEVSSFMAQAGYQYLIMEPASCVVKYGENASQKFINNIAAYPAFSFTQELSNKAFFVFRKL